MGRIHASQDEKAEAAVAFAAVLTSYEEQKKSAVEALKQPDQFKNDPWEKSRLEALVKGPPPDYVAGAAFYGACLNYEAGKFGEALPKFQAFAKEYRLLPAEGRRCVCAPASVSSSPRTSTRPSRRSSRSRLTRSSAIKRCTGSARRSSARRLRPIRTTPMAASRRSRSRSICSRTPHSSRDSWPHRATRMPSLAGPRSCSNRPTRT